MPFDLADLSNDDLMNLFGMFVQWANYTSVEVVRASVEADDVEAQLHIAEAKYIILNTEQGKPGLQRARAERYSDEEVQRLAKLLRRKKAYSRLVTVLLGNTERSSQLLSRELTRRIGFAPIEGRRVGP